MKWTATKEDLKKYHEKFGGENAVTGYAEESKLLAFPLPKFYFVVADENNITLVQFNLKFEEKNSEVIPVNSIKEIRISGAVAKRLTIVTESSTVKLAIKTQALGIQSEQKQFIERIKQYSQFK